MFRTCLLAVDIVDDDVPKKLTDTAIELMDKGAALHVVNVVPDSGMAIVGQYLGPDHSARVMADAQTRLAEWAAQVLPDGATLHVAQGNVYDQILRTAGSVAADVICIGAHRPALRDYLIGPNAARVVRHATQSVLVIR